MTVDDRCDESMTVAVRSFIGGGQRLLNSNRCILDFTNRLTLLMEISFV